MIEKNKKNYWSVLKGALLEATGRSCGCTKGPVGHKETWWGNDDVSNSVSEKWKQGSRRKTVYQAKCKAERKGFGNVMQQDDQKCH